MRWTVACLPCAERPTGKETTGSRWRSSWIIPTCPALREPPSRPKDVYVYGDTLYAVNDADNQYSVEVFGLASGGKKHLGSIKKWKRGEATGKFGGRRTVSPVPTTRFMSPTKEAGAEF